MELVTLTSEMETCFQHFYYDFVANDPSNADFYADGIRDFPSYLQQLDDHRLGLNLPEDYVPCSSYWLMDDERNLVGAIRLRHHIDNEFLASECGHIGYDIAPSFRRRGFGTVMLALVLPEAAKLGINMVLLTADEDNWGSRKVIEANGGELEGVVQGKVFPGMLARYWVRCAGGDLVAKAEYEIDR